MLILLIASGFNFASAIYARFFEYIDINTNATFHTGLLFLIITLLYYVAFTLRDLVATKV